MNSDKKAASYYSSIFYIIITKIKTLSDPPLPFYTIFKNIITIPPIARFTEKIEDFGELRREQSQNLIIMNTIAFETTEKSASVAIFENERLTYFAQLPLEIRSAQSLAPGLKKALTQTGLQPTQIGLVAVAQGPGSFTGLRVGVVSAKTFAWAVNADIIGVDSMEVCAHQAPQNVEKISVAFDCQRGQVIYRSFDRAEDGTFVPAGDEKTVVWRDWLAQTEPDRWLSGPYVSRIDPALLENRLVVAPELRSPTAQGVGELAIRQYAAGKKDVLWDLLPHYSRPAAAEEKRMVASNK